MKAIDKNDVFVYLDELLESDEANMFRAAPFVECVEDEFGCTRKEAQKLLSEWMRTFSQRHSK